MKPKIECKYSVCYGFSTIYSDVETAELAFELIRGLICRNDHNRRRKELLEVLDLWQGRALAVPETDFPRFYLCGYFGNYAIYQTKKRAKPWKPARRK
jgi:hypothetical protein